MFLLSILIVSATNQLAFGQAEKVIIKVNPGTCTSCYAKAQSFLNSTDASLIFIFDNSFNKEDASYFVHEMFDKDSKEADITISDSAYKHFSRSNQTEIFTFKDGIEQEYVVLDSKANYKIDLHLRKDSIINGCADSRFLFAKKGFKKDNMYYFADDRYPLYTGFDINSKSCKFSVSFDSANVRNIYEILGIKGDSAWFYYLENYDALKRYNRAFPRIHAFIKQADMNLTIMSIPFVTKEIIEEDQYVTLGSRNILAKWRNDTIEEIYSIDMNKFDSLSILNSFGYFIESRLTIPLLNKSLTKTYIGTFKKSSGEYICDSVKFLSNLIITNAKVLKLPFYSNGFIFSNYYKTVYCTNKSDSLPIHKYLNNSHFDPPKVFLHDLYFHKNIISVVYKSVWDDFYFDRWLLFPDNSLKLVYRKKLDIESYIKSRLFLFNENQILYIDNDNNLKLNYLN